MEAEWSEERTVARRPTRLPAPRPPASSGREYEQSLGDATRCRQIRTIVQSSNLVGYLTFRFALGFRCWLACASLWDAQRTDIRLSAADRTELEAVVVNRNSAQKHVWRAKIV